MLKLLNNVHHPNHVLILLNDFVAKSMVGRKLTLHTETQLNKVMLSCEIFIMLGYLIISVQHLSFQDWNTTETPEHINCKNVKNNIPLRGYARLCT